MKRTLLAASVASLISVLFFSTPVEARKFSDATGRFSVEAEVEQLKEHSVVLKKRDGRLVEVPIARLSKADQEYLRALRTLSNANDSIAGAKQAMRSLFDVQTDPSFSRMAPNLTNESAAAVSIGLMVPVSLMAAFSRDEEMKSEFEKLSEKLSEKFGFEAGKGLDESAALEQFKGHGREILTDVGEFIDRRIKATDKQKVRGVPSSLKIPDQIAKLRFSALSANRVKIEVPDAPAETASIEARFEDGRWRIHLGDFDALTKQMGLEREKPPQDRSQVLVKAGGGGVHEDAGAGGFDAIAVEDFEKTWKVDLHVKDQPARKVLGELARELGASVVTSQELSGALKEPIVVSLDGVSRLEAIEHVCRQVGLYPDYEITSVFSLDDGPDYCEKTIILRKGPRPCEVQFAGPFLVEVERVDASELDGHRKLTVKVTGLDLPPAVVNLTKTLRGRPAIDEIEDSEGRDLHEAEGLRRQLHLYMPVMSGATCVLCEPVLLKDVLENISVIKTIRGSMRVFVPTQVESLRFTDLKAGATKKFGEVEVTLRGVEIGATSKFGFECKGVAREKITFLPRDENGGDLENLGGVSMGGKSNFAVRGRVASVTAKIIADVKEIPYAFQFNDIPWEYRASTTLTLQILGKGVSDDEAILARLEALTGVERSEWSSIGSPNATFFISPVANPSDLASKIDFGEVLAVQDGVIYVFVKRPPGWTPERDRHSRHDVDGRGLFLRKADEVTIEIAGPGVSQDTSLREKCYALRGEGSGSSSSISPSKNALTVNLRPVPDASALAGKIDFGRVLDVEGNLVFVFVGKQTTPMSERKPPPPDAKPANTRIEQIHDATFKGDLNEVRKLLKQEPELVVAGDKSGRKPLHRAARAGRREVVELLLAHGADVNATDQTATTALHVAAWDGHKEIAEVLLSNNAQVNAAKKDGWTPLHAAAVKGHKELVELLLTNEADVSARHLNGNTPMHCAAAFGDENVVAVLLAHGADVNARNRDRQTPLNVADSWGHAKVVELLRKHAEAPPREN